VEGDGRTMSQLRRADRAHRGILPELWNGGWNRRDLRTAAAAIDR
jgi:hypothetical protein